MVVTINCYFYKVRKNMDQDRAKPDFAGSESSSLSDCYKQQIINKKYLFGTIGTTDQPHKNSARRKPARRKKVNEEFKNHQNHYCSDSGEEGGAYRVP